MNKSSAGNQNLKIMAATWLLTVLLYQPGYPQTNVFPPNGNVGIGTASPSRNLEVFDSTDPFILLKSDNNQATLHFRKQATGDDAYIRYHSNGRMAFQLDGANASGVEANEYLTILDNGNTGIGIAAPSVRLEVNGPIRLANQEPVYFAGGPSDPNYLIQSGAWDDGMKYKHWTSHQFYTSGTEKMRILKDGNVGIGTSVPTAKLEVGVEHAANESEEMRIGSYWQGNFVGIGFNYQLNSSGTVSKHILEHHNGSSYQAMTFKLGQVGIGTTSPDAKLTVKGDVHAEEVRVDLNVPAPDYVFAKDYDLPSLESISEYIEAHQHLPEIPPAEEMEADGIDLGVMNMLLLKKVEELTLHQIELLRMLQSQQDEIDQLKQQLK